MTSSAYHPESNGHAEQAVKSAKHLLRKLNSNLAQFRSHLQAWRNTPRADGFSPAQLFFGRRLRAGLPMATSGVNEAGTNAAATAARKSAAQTTKESFDERAHSLPPLKPGERVRIFDSASGSWGGDGNCHRRTCDRRVVHNTTRRSFLNLYQKPEASEASTFRNRGIKASSPDDEASVYLSLIHI